MATSSPNLPAVPVALQLYTVREQLKHDFQGVLHAVAKMGYDGVQLSGVGDRSAAEIRRVLDETGLQPVGTHTGLDALESRLDQEIDYNLEVGTPWIVVPSLPAPRRQNLAGWREVTAAMNRIGERCNARGAKLGYHNHDFEFAPIPDGNGQRGIDVLLGESDPALLFWEPDVYWVTKGNDDPAAMIRQQAGRIPITHLKDSNGEGRQAFAEVGEGTLDWPAILKASEAAGVEWHCVEQDRCDRDPLESAALSLRHLHSWGMGLRRP